MNGFQVQVVALDQNQKENLLDQNQLELLLIVVNIKKTKNPKCKDQEGCEWIAGTGCSATVARPEPRGVARPSGAVAGAVAGAGAGAGVPASKYSKYLKVSIAALKKICRW